MKKFCYVLATLATVGIALPSVATAEDKPMMKEGMGEKPMMHHHMHHHYHHHMMMKKPMMDKKM
jgi:hypothetical protein